MTFVLGFISGVLVSVFMMCLMKIKKERNDK